MDSHTPGVKFPDGASNPSRQGLSTGLLAVGGVHTGCLPPALRQQFKGPQIHEENRKRKEPGASGW